ncbi:histidine kinase [Gordonia sp. CPCC 205515]|uniref:sensor histidine kinase n=1 Tax=Gordonia sp. CPCC 205515 TaxID=3140791 RepID=UPI003AF3D212
MTMFQRVRATGSATAVAATRVVSQLPPARDPAVRHYFSSRVNWFFLAVAAIMYAISWPVLPQTHDLPAYTLPVVAAFAAFPLAFAWAAPVGAWAVSVVSAQLIGLLVPTVNGWEWGIQVTHLIALLVLTLTAYLRAPMAWLPVIWLCTSVVLFQVAPPSARGGWVFAATFAVVVVALARAVVSSRRELAVRSEETQLVEAQKAILEERTRIARDLHDIVAHRMSVVVVMAQTARYRLDDVSDSAATEFEQIAVAARASLDEVRQLLGVLRTDDGASALPAPGLDDIDSLVAATRLTGATVTVGDTVEHEQVGDAAAMVIYRIVQESLANATRHAPGAPIDVRLTDGAAGLVDVDIRNAGPTGAPVGLPGLGTGIAGMAERAAALGGALTAGPDGSGGFRVHAQIPAHAGSVADTLLPAVGH